MKTEEHKKHLQARISYNSCRECRADTERRFLSKKWQYEFISDYLAWAKPRFAAIHAGNNTPSAVTWRNDFHRALDKRITLKAGDEMGRKRCDSYLERLGQFPRSTNATYLRQFAKEGASCLRP